MGSGASNSNKNVDLPDKIDLHKFKAIAGKSYSKILFDNCKDSDDYISKERLLGLNKIITIINNIKDKFNNIIENNKNNEGINNINNNNNDKSDNNTINVTQLRQIITELNINDTNNTLDSIVNKSNNTIDTTSSDNDNNNNNKNNCDVTNDKRYTLQEVLNILLNVMQDNETEKEIISTFQLFDYNNDGYITSDELVQGYKEYLGEHITVAEAEEMIKEADVNNDGRIDLLEYSKKMTVEA